MEKILSYDNGWCNMKYVENIWKHTHTFVKPHLTKFRTAIDIGCRFGQYTENIMDDFNFNKMREIHLINEKEKDVVLEWNE